MAERTPPTGTGPCALERPGRLGLLAGLLLPGLFPVPGQAGMPVDRPASVYRDFERDSVGDIAHPQRLKLVRQEGLRLGRMAGVWGSIGGRDKGDAYFIGQTPDAARLQLRLAAHDQGGAVTVRVVAKDGRKTTRHEITANPGQEVVRWLRLAGKITLLVEPGAPQEKTYYALYVWYPGDRVDGLSRQEFKALLSGDAPTIDTFARRKK